MADSTRRPDWLPGQQDILLRLEALKREGRRVAGHYCAWTPLEALDAAGIAVIPLGATGDGNIHDAERDLPKNLCPLIKSSYGAAVGGNSLIFELADVIIGETTCDGKKKVYDLLGRVKQTYVLQMPQSVDQGYARPMWVKEIRRFIRYLEETFSVVITDEALRQAAEKRNRLRAARRGLMELQKSTPAPLSSAELYAFLEESEAIFDVDEAIRATEGFTRAVLARGGEGIAAAKAKRILVTGCPIGGVVGKITVPIEENGGRVVCYENCKGIKGACVEVDTGAADIVEGIADAYLRLGCAVMHNNTLRRDSLVQLMRDFDVNGVVDVAMQTCHTYTIEARAIRKLCGDNQMPYLAVETDYSAENAGQLATRMAAFIEMMG